MTFEEIHTFYCILELTKHNRIFRELEKKLNVLFLKIILNNDFRTGGNFPKLEYCSVT